MILLCEILLREHSLILGCSRRGLGTSRRPRQELILSETSHLGLEVGTSRAGLAGQTRFFCAAEGELGVSPGKEGEARRGRVGGKGGGVAAGRCLRRRRARARQEGREGSREGAAARAARGWIPPALPRSLSRSLARSLLPSPLPPRPTPPTTPGAGTAGTWRCALSL